MRWAPLSGIRPTGATLPGAHKGRYAPAERSLATVTKHFSCCSHCLDNQGKDGRSKRPQFLT